jgi:hypothetical protein
MDAALSETLSHARLLMRPSQLIRVGIQSAAAVADSAWQDLEVRPNGLTYVQGLVMFINRLRIMYQA